MTATGAERMRIRDISELWAENEELKCSQCGKPYGGQDWYIREEFCLCEFCKLDFHL